MSIPKTETIIISRKGVARGVHSPVIDALTKKLGEAEIQRASNVEPTGELSPKALGILHADPIRGIYVIRPQAPAGETIFVPNPYQPVKWWADMEKSQPGLVLGPYDTREIALAEEVAWLHANHIPICHPCRASS